MKENETENPFARIEHRFNRLDELILKVLTAQMPKVSEEDDLPDKMDVKETSKETGYKVSYIYEMKENGEIPFHQKSPKQKIWFSRKEIRAWMKTGRPDIMQKAVDLMVSEQPKKRKEVKHG